jgi:hypothetical protein
MALVQISSGFQEAAKQLLIVNRRAVNHVPATLLVKSNII